ncbi:MAG: hypothetical protein QXO76_12185 [Thermoproteota archaeon]
MSESMRTLRGSLLPLLEVYAAPLVTTELFFKCFDVTVAEC